MLPAWTTTCERIDRGTNCTRLWNISFSIFPSNPNLILLLSTDMYPGSWYSCWPIEAEARQRRFEPIITTIKKFQCNTMGASPPPECPAAAGAELVAGLAPPPGASHVRFQVFILTGLNTNKITRVVSKRTILRHSHHTHAHTLTHARLSTRRGNPLHT